MRRPRVEILSFQDCPNHEPARTLVERLGRHLRLEPEIRALDVADPDAAVALACRIYRSDGGVAEQPNERWVRDAQNEVAK